MKESQSPACSQENLTAKVSPNEGDKARVTFCEAVGVDVVHVPSFAAQLRIPGTRLNAVFHDSEWEYCGSRSGDGSGAQAEACLAARWAAKEAVVKAWSGLLLGEAPVLSEQGFPWAEIVVAHDSWRRPYLRFYGRIEAALQEFERSRSVSLKWHLSVSHDADMSIAYVHVRGVPVGADACG